MDIVEHYIKNSSLVDIPVDLNKILIQEDGLAKASLLRGDGRKEIFIDNLENGSIFTQSGDVVKIKDKKLWSSLKKQLVSASGSLPDSWNKDFNTATGVALGKISKKESGLGKGSRGPTGEDWEAMIVVGVALNDKKNPATECPSEWERVEKKWVPPYIDSALSLAKEFKSKGLVPLSQSGTSKGSLTNEWNSWRDIGGGTKNATAKTDLTGGSKKISLKKSGGSQAMSAKNGEAIATFYAACDILGKNSSSQVNKIIDTLKDGVMSMDDEEFPYKGEIGELESDLKKLEKDGDKAFSPDKVKKLKIWKDRLEQGRLDGAKVTTDMNKLFLDNNKFKEAFVFEASSGSRKFGDSSEARADYLVEFDAGSGKISHEYSMRDESDQIKQLASMFKFYMSFKSSGKSAPYMALRGNLVLNPSKVTKWMKNVVGISESLVNLDYCPTFDTIVREAFAQHSECNLLLEDSSYKSYLTEGRWSFDGFKKWMSDTYDSAKDKVKSGYQTIKKKTFDKLKKMWEWIKERVNIAFEWIKRQGAKALQFLLRFLGIEVNGCKADGGPFALFPNE